MKTDNHERLINDKSHSRAETLTDLPVAVKQATETKGGANPHFVSATSTVTLGTGL